MEWLEAAVMASLCAALFGLLAWVMRGGTERAGLYFITMALVLALDGFVSLAGGPAFLLPLDTEFAGPIAGWLSYRGCCAMAGVPPRRGDRALATTAVALWIVAHNAGAVTLRVAIGTGVGVIFLAGGATALIRTARTPIQKLFAWSAWVPVVFLAMHPLTETGHLDVAVEASVWFGVLSCVGLLGVCAALERREETARRHREQLALGAEVAGLGLWTYDPEADTYQWNDHQYRQFDLAPGDPIPDRQAQLEAIVPGDRDRLRSAIEALERDGRDLDIELEYRTEAGNTRWLRSRARRLDSPGAHHLIVGTSLDLTDLRAALAELERYREKLEALVDARTAALEKSQRQLEHQRRLASVGTLAAGLAHQVNNPVGAILMAAEFARYCEGEPDELQVLRRAMEDIVNEARRCGDLVHDMLRFASDRPTQKKRIALDAVIERVQRAMQRLSREHGATVELELPDRSPIVEASAVEVEQALFNLIENAIQSGPPGRRIDVVRRIEGEFAVIEVRDDGEGIPPEHLESVLDPFYTTRLESGGTGLGLSVAHGIAREHGGDLSIVSRPGVGTTVSLSLPRFDGETPDDEAGPPRAPGRVTPREAVHRSGPGGAPA